MTLCASRRRAVAFCCALLALQWLPSEARAQPYPNRVIRLIVPFAAGGINDNVARIVQPYLQEKLGQTVIVENKPGASGIVGTDYVAKSPPDGYTLLVVASSHTVVPATNAKLPFDTARDLAAVSLLARDPMLYVVGEKVAAKTIAELVALAKQEPGKLTYATPGTDSQSHFLTELFNQTAGIKMTEVPYRGGAPAVLSLIAGDTQFAILSTQLTAPHIESGKLRVLASGGATRGRAYPQAPSIHEAGFPQAEAQQWVGLLAPAKTPDDIVNRLNTAVREALALPEVAQKFDTQSTTAAASTPAEFQTLIEREVRQWREVGRAAGIAKP